MSCSGNPALDAPERAPAPRRISAADTHALRQAILRPHQTRADMTFAGDEAPEAAHWGLFEQNELVAIATVVPETAPPELADAEALRGPSGGHWRLRGMATRAERRGLGYGRALVAACAAHARTHGATLLWCHARTAAQPFYAALGLRAYGSVFELPEIGPHIVMARPLAGAPAQGADSARKVPPRPSPGPVTRPAPEEGAQPHPRSPGGRTC